MTGFPRWFLRLLAASTMVAAAIFIVRPMASYRALALGADAGAVGYVAAAFGVLPLVLAVPVGRWVDRRDREGFIAGGAVLVAAACGLLAVTTRVWQVVALNAVVGLGHLGNVLGSQALLASGSAEREHDRRFGLFAMTVSLGQLVGPLIGGYVAARSGSVAVGGERVPVTTWSMIVAAVTAALGAAVVIRLGEPGRPGEQREQREKREYGYGRAVRAPTTAEIGRTPGIPRAVFASLSVVACVDLLTAYLPVLGQQRGVPVGFVGVLLAIRAGAAMVSRLWVHGMVRHLGRRRLLTASMVLAAGGLALLPVAENRAVLSVVMGLTGFLLGVVAPLTMTWVVQLVNPRVRATALALRLAGNRVGQVAVPTMSGLVAGVVGVGGVFWLLGGLLGIATVGVVRRGPGSPPRADGTDRTPPSGERDQ